MKHVTVRQIQQLDHVAINRYGVPSLALMENAGRSVALAIIRSLKRRKGKRVCVIAGLGNNAGDGFVVARHLLNANVKVDIILIGKGSRLKHDAAVNYKILKKLKYPILETKKVTQKVTQTVKKADIVVDAIFGVGLNREVGDPFRSFIETINRNGRYVVAVDIPSGLNGTTGEVFGVCVKANQTVTFSFTKQGFLRRQGPKHTGKVCVIDIGIPIKLTKSVKLKSQS